MGRRDGCYSRQPVETTIRQPESVSSAATGTHHRHGANGPLARFGILHCAPFRPRTQWTATPRRLSLGRSLREHKKSASVAYFRGR